MQLTVRHMTCFPRNGATVVRLYIEEMNGVIVKVQELPWKKLLTVQHHYKFKRLAGASDTTRAK